MVNHPQALHAVRALLSTGDELDRCCACRTLGTLGDPTVVADLVERLQDDDIDVCVDAAIALGRLGDTAAVEPLLESLRNDPSGEVKTAAVAALSNIGGHEAIPYLLNIAGQPPEDIVWDDDEEAWDGWWDMQRNAVEALGRLRVTEAVPILTVILEDDAGQDIENEVLTALALIGGSAEDTLIQRLTGGSPRERRRAAQALSLATAPESADALENALEDEHAEVRAAAIRALAHRDGTRHLATILACLKDPSTTARQAALDAAARLSKAGGTALDSESLASLLSDESPIVRATALKVLAEQYPATADENPESTSAHLQQQIQTLLTDPDPNVASAACPLASRTHDPDIQDALLNILADTGNDSTLRREAALALGTWNPTHSTLLTGLTQALGDQDQAVRLAALNALMALVESPRHDPHNECATPEETPAPLAIIIEALQGEIQLDTPQASADTSTPDQISAAHEKEEEICAAPAANDEDGDADFIAPVEPETEQLPHRIDATLPPVASTLDAIALDNVEATRQGGHSNDAEDNVDISHLAADEQAALTDYMRILEKKRAMKARLFDEKTLDIATDVRCLAARILGNSTHPAALSALKHAIHDEQPDVQRDAVDALARHIGHTTDNTAELTDIIGPLTRFLHLSGDRDLRLASARALGALGNPIAVPSLVARLNDEDALIRVQTVHALAELLCNSAASHGQAPLDRLVDDTAASQIIDALLDRLDDTASGVRTSAALALGKLSPFIHPEARRLTTIDQLIAAGFSDEGQQARDIGNALRALDPEQAGTRLLQTLETLPTSIERRFAIEMLEEILKPPAAA